MGRTGLILEGGAFRGVFTSGVLDVLMENGIRFDYVIGVSAGAGNGLSYVSGQIGRTREVIKPRDHSQQYFGAKQIIKHGKFLNLDKMFFEYPYKQYPYDFDRFKESATEMEIVISNCDTGKAEYYDERVDINRMLNIGKASCSVPILCKPVAIGEYHYLDGSVIDSIPIKRALDKGCDRLLVVMTKTRTETPTDYGRMKAIMAAIYKKNYPKFYEALLKRTAVYKKQLKLLNKLEEEGTALVLRPSVECIKKFEQNDEKVEAFYQNGRTVAADNLEAIKKYAGIASEN